MSRQNQPSSRIEKVLDAIENQYSEVMTGLSRDEISELDPMGQAVMAKVADIFDEQDDEDVMFEKAREVIQSISNDLLAIKGRI